MKKIEDEFDKAEIDEFDLVEIDEFDVTELDPEDKVLYSKQLRDMVREEVTSGVALAEKVIKKEVEKKLSDLKKEDRLAETLDKKSKEIEGKIERLKENHEKAINSLYSQSSAPQYQFGGFAPPNPDGHVGQFLKTDGTWAGISWEDAGGGGAIGATITGGTEGSVLFVDADGFLAQDNANFNFDSIFSYLTAGARLIVKSGTNTGSFWIGTQPKISLQDSTGSEAASFSPYDLTFAGVGGVIQNVGNLNFSDATVQSTAFDPANLEIPLTGFIMNDGTNRWRVTIDTSGVIQTALITAGPAGKFELETGDFLLMENNDNFILES